MTPRQRSDALSARLGPRAAPAILTAIGALSFLVALWLAIKVVPEWLASTERLSDASQRAEEIGRTRTAVLAMLAGVLAAIGAYYTHRTFGLNRQGQITERFTRAVDQLGNPSIDVRLGGIYALERLARESRDDHGPIVEILTAFVRERATAAPDASEHDRPADDHQTRKLPQTDVQAAVTVLGRRRVHYDPPPPWRLELPDVALPGIRLIGAHLERANLEGAQLQEADLSRAHLQEADLFRAHLEGAELIGARLEGASLPYAHLTGALLIDANLRGAVLLEADLEGVQHSAGTVWPESFDRDRLRGARL